MGRRRQAIVASLALWACTWITGMPALACEIETPDGYRLDHYRSPTPCDLPGAEVVDALELKEIIRAEDPILIDAMPLIRTGETDFTGRWTVPEPRENIPGSVWLPNIGYGTLDDEMTTYFQGSNLRAGNRRRSSSPAGHLLLCRLLDVLECSEASAGIRLSPGYLVSRRNRWLEGDRCAPCAIDAGAAVRGVTMIPVLARVLLIPAPPYDGSV